MYYKQEPTIYLIKQLPNKCKMFDPKKMQNENYTDFEVL